MFDLQGHGRGIDECQSSSTETDKRGTGSHSRSAFREGGVLQEHVTHSQVQSIWLINTSQSTFSWKQHGTVLKHKNANTGSS